MVWFVKTQARMAKRDRAGAVHQEGMATESELELMCGTAWVVIAQLAELTGLPPRNFALVLFIAKTNCTYDVASGCSRFFEMTRRTSKSSSGSAWRDGL